MFYTTMAFKQNASLYLMTDCAKLLLCSSHNKMCLASSMFCKVSSGLARRILLCSVSKFNQISFISQFSETVANLTPFQAKVQTVPLQAKILCANDFHAKDTSKTTFSSAQEKNKN